MIPPASQHRLSTVSAPSQSWDSSFQNLTPLCLNQPLIQTPKVTWKVVDWKSNFMPLWTLQRLAFVQMLDVSQRVVCVGVYYVMTHSLTRSLPCEIVAHSVATFLSKRETVRPFCLEGAQGNEMKYASAIDNETFAHLILWTDNPVKSKFRKFNF